ncbi:MAG: XRE family transcriptional regulator [bacterium]
MADPIHVIKRQLATEIARALGPMSQYSIAPSYGIPQPRMSELDRGNVDRCTIDWLVRRIHRMGGSVTVSVTLGDVKGDWMRSRLAAMRRGSSPGRLP